MLLLSKQFHAVSTVKRRFYIDLIEMTTMLIESDHELVIGHKEVSSSNHSTTIYDKTEKTVYVCKHSRGIQSMLKSIADYRPNLRVLKTGEIYQHNTH
jgi:hypothetical protein